MILTVAIAFVAGALLGGAHFGSLWWSSALLRDGRTVAGVGTQALRFGALGLALALVARQGAPALLAASLGVVTARRIFARLLRRSA